jgi:hypothetical protein
VNNLGIDFTGDMEQAINDLPNTLTVGSRTYNVVADDERRSVEVLDEGQYATYDRNVTAILSQFRTVPAIQSTVTLDDLKYFVADLTRNRETDTLVMTLRRSDG